MPRGLKKLKTADETLDRVQQAVDEAIRRLELAVAGVQTDITTAVAAIDPPNTLALAAFGSAPNANGATLAYAAPAYTLTLQPASATQPGGVTATGTQTFAGIKEFGEVHISSTLKMTGTNSIQFFSTSTEYIRYAGGSGIGTGTNIEFGSAQGFYFNNNVWLAAAQLSANRYHISTRDDKSAAPGNFTTTAHAGRCAIAAGATAVVITNNTAGKAFAATDEAFVTFIDLDGTATVVKAVMTANTLTITANAAATANTRLSWFVVKG